MTPHEAAVQCLSYAAWKRQAFAALAREKHSDHRAERPIRLTEADILEAKQHRQDLLDALAQQARRERWFPGEQRVSTEDVLDYLREAAVALRAHQIAQRFEYSRDAMRRILNKLVARGLVQGQTVVIRGHQNVFFTVSEEQCKPHS